MKEVLLAVSIIAGSLPISALLASEPTANREAVHPLVSAEDLANQLDNASLHILDIRSYEAFVEARVPRSRWIDAEKWRGKTFEPTGLTDKPYWEEALNQAGIRASDEIVIVGDALPEISRAWWLLRYLGLEQVRVLDGGFAAWKKEDRSLASGEADAADLPLEAVGERLEVNFQPNRLGVLADVLPEALKDDKVRVLDNRSPAEYTGTRGIGTRTGHIPNAIHLPWQDLVDEEGKFLATPQLVDLLRGKGVDAAEPIVTHCQTGGRSAVAALALELVGATNVKNYYLGWGEYAGALTAPVEKSNPKLPPRADP